MHVVCLFAQSFSLFILFVQGFGEEMLSAVGDGDTHAGKMIMYLYRKFELLTCSGHMNKNLGKQVDEHSSKKGGLKGITAKCVCHGQNHRYATDNSARVRRRPRARRGPVVDVDTTTVPNDESIGGLTVAVIKQYLRARRLPTTGKLAGWAGGS